MIQNHPILIKPEALAGKLDLYREVFLILDYDGTLVPIAPRPELARPDEGLLADLKQLCGLPCYKVAILSGRVLEELKELLPVPGLYLSSVHGVLIEDPAGNLTALASADIEPVINRLYTIAVECIGDKKGYIIENKLIDLTIHFRLADPGAGDVLKSFIEKSKEVCEEFGLEFLEGKKVLEIRPKGLHKGKFIDWVRGKAPLAYITFIGDDTTDEDAFACLEEGLGVLVSKDSRPSKASLRLNSPGEVQEFLRLLITKKRDY
ncbi:MAG TPA: trehalose-phosphatase [Desulfotomaculum sp.]|nr:MAG: Trehalose-phosphatase [Desulfotomaculum sp. 46_80]HAG11811.1 trehalose-phosphatase [Desulfotomaculum sp.]HBY03346.1 trehalose-phosphatase [Desulfotomaculum sp.]